MEWLIKSNINKICMFCKKKYGEVETTSTGDSHGICPECSKFSYAENMRKYKERMAKEKRT